MDPITIMAATSIVSAGAQWLSSDAARKSSDKERKRIEALVDGLQDPDFDLTRLTPEDYHVVDKYIPEVASYMQEVAPTTVKGDSKEASRGLDAQYRALDKYRKLSDSGIDTQGEIALNQAMEAARSQNQGQQGAIQDSFARRGMGGSNMEMIASLLGQQQASDLNRKSAENALKEAEMRRFAAIQSEASLGGGMRQDALNLENANTNRINDYNQRFAANQNTQNRYEADTRNSGQLYNVQTAQRVADQNTQQHNTYDMRNQDMGNQYAQQKFQNDSTKIGLQTGTAMNNISGINQGAQDRNNAISGIASGITGMAQYGDQKDERQKDRDAYADRYYQGSK